MLPPLHRARGRGEWRASGVLTRFKAGWHEDTLSMTNLEDAPLQQLRKRLSSLKANYPTGSSTQVAVAVELGALIRALREQRGWSIHQLAKVADCNLRPVHRLEAGRALPSTAFISRLLYAFEHG